MTYRNGDVLMLTAEISPGSYEAISAHPKHGAGEFPFKCVKLGRL